MSFLENLVNNETKWTYISERDLMQNADTGMLLDPVTKSVLERRKNIWVLHLRGTPYERGLAHGKLMKDVVQKTNISKFYGGMLKDLINSSDLEKKVPSFLKNFVINAVENWYYSPLERNCLDETVEEMNGIADGASIDRKEAVRAMLSPDIMEHLAAGFLKFGKESLGNYYLGGCTAFYLRKSSLRKNAYSIFARNLDFPGAMVWRPTIVFNHPSEKIDVIKTDDDGSCSTERVQKQKYAYITGAGFPGFGLTGFNESGICMSTHVCLSKEYSQKGLPTLDFNHYLFTRARSLDDISLLINKKGLRSTSPHAVVFADKDEAFSLEVDASNCVVRPMSDDYDIHIQTNHFLNPSMRKREMEFVLERENTVGRARLLRSLIDGNYGNIDLQKAIDMISSNIDVYSKQTALVGDFPAQCSTLNSVVMIPRTGNLWVASGNPPAVCYNEYSGFNFYDEIEGNGRKTRVQSLKRSNRRLLDDIVFTPVTEKMKTSLSDFYRSQEALNLGKVDSSLLFLNRAISRHNDPGYNYVKVFVEMKLGNIHDALETLEYCKNNFIYSPIKSDALSLLEGRCYDVIGDRDKACSIYKAALENKAMPSNLKSAFKHSLRYKFRLENLPNTIDFAFMGPLEFH